MRDRERQLAEVAKRLAEVARWYVEVHRGRATSAVSWAVRAALCNGLFLV